jgi:HEPN domain-containing protein
MDPQAPLMLRKAASDRYVLDFALPDEIFGFHAQQAFEKLFKALIAARGIRYERTHVFKKLLDQLNSLNEPPLPVPFQFLTLEPFAVLMRYDEAGPFDEVQRQAIREAIDVLTVHISERLKLLGS